MKISKMITLRGHEMEVYFEFADQDYTIYSGEPELHNINLKPLGDDENTRKKRGSVNN